MSGGKEAREYAKRVVQVVVYGKPVSAKFPLLNEQGGRARGSGFFVRLGQEPAPRYILTAAHVVEDAFVENGVKVILPLYGQEELPAQVKVLVPEMDLAVLEMDPTGKEKFVDAFALGDDHKLEFGTETPLLVLGYPLGQEQLKVLRCNFSGRQDMGIQTDCAVNKGNSGGPLVFKDHIVGWVSSGVHPTMAHNVSWAIPINQFRALVPKILEKLKSQRNQGQSSPVLRAPHAGILYHSSSSANNTGQCQGVVIQYVSQGSVLHGVAQPGDQLCSLEFGGHQYHLDSRGEVQVPWYFAKLPFAQVAAEISYDTPVTFHLWDSRQQQMKKHTTPLNNPNRGGFLVQSLRYEPLPYEMFGGMVIMPFRGNHLADFPHLRAALSPHEREQDWLIVTHVAPGSEMYELGVITPGDLLKTVNDQPVTTLEDLKQVLQQPYQRPGQGAPQRVVKFETREGASVVLDWNKALAEEGLHQRQMGFTEQGQGVSLLQSLSHSSSGKLPNS